MSIQVDSISKSYGEQKALNQVSFQAKEGEIVGFLGPNGAGKSTMMKILTGFLNPDQGEALINGIDIQTDAINAKKSIGYLPEQNPLYEHMYVIEYLKFQASIYKVPSIVIHSVLEDVGLQSESHKKIGQLSKGYQQRVGLAAAILHNPDVLILDEPTTGLDPNQLIEIRELIKSLGKKKTILFSSHIMQEVEAMCDRIIILDKGEIKLDSSVKGLSKSIEDLFIELTQS